MMTPEQIAADRAVQNAATPGPWLEVVVGDCSGKRVVVAIRTAAGWTQKDIPDCDAAFIVAARTRWPAALDEVERLQRELGDLTADVLSDVDTAGYYGENTESAMQCWREKCQRLTAENAALSGALAKSGHAEDCDSEKRFVHVEPCPFWTKGYCLTEVCIHGTEMGDVCAECPGSVRLFGAERCHPFPCNCYLSTLSDAVARGKKVMDLERRDTPVVIQGAGLGVCVCGEDTSGPIFCGHCGSRLVWQ